MRIDRFSALGTLALLLLGAGGCSSGTTTTTPIPAPVPPAVPSPVLLRFIHGSPGTGSGGSGTVDVCIDTSPFSVTQPFGGATTASPSVNYGGSSPGLYLVNAPHVVSVYNGIGASAGAECATAPGAYLGNAPIATTVLPAGSNARWTIVLGGASGGPTFGLYVFNEPTYLATPGGFNVVTHNAAPVFSTGKPNGVGFGICTTTVTPCAATVAITGAQGRAIATASTPSAAVINGYVASALTSIPAGFYDGSGVAAGTPVPITSIASPSPIPFQPYVVLLYAVDAPAGGLNLIARVETSSGFPF